MTGSTILLALLGCAGIVRGVFKITALAFPVPWRSWYDSQKWPSRFESSQLRCMAYLSESITGIADSLVGAAALAMAIEFAMLSDQLLPNDSRITYLIIGGLALIAWLVHFGLDFVISRQQTSEVKTEWNRTMIRNFLVWAISLAFGLLMITILREQGKAAFIVVWGLLVSGGVFFLGKRARWSLKIRLLMVLFFILPLLIGWFYGLVGIIVFGIGVFLILTISDKRRYQRRA